MQALNLFNVVLLSMPPILTSQGVRELLTRLRPQLLLRLPAVLGPPATARELASPIIARVWVDVLMTAIYAFTPVYSTLGSLPLWLRAAAIVFNPYALSMEVARAVVHGAPVALADVAALAALSALWFTVKLMLA